MVVSDVDGDGWPDIVAINEGPDAMETHNGEYGGIRAYLNRKKGTSWHLDNLGAVLAGKPIGKPSW